MEETLILSKNAKVAVLRIYKKTRLIEIDANVWSHIGSIKNRISLCFLKILEAITSMLFTINLFI